MAKPVETRKPDHGLGRLIRYSRNGAWTWQRWDSKARKWTTLATRQVNFSKAREWVFQQVAKVQPMPQRPRLLFTTVVNEYFEARRAGRGGKPLRDSSIKRLGSNLAAFRSFLGSRFDTVLLDEIDTKLLDAFLHHEIKRTSITWADASLDFIGQILSHAVKRKYVPENTAQDVERIYGKANGTDEPDDQRILGWACPSREEVALIIANAGAQLVATGKRVFNGSQLGRPVYRGINKNDLRDLYRGLTLTGLRVGEARFLTWQDIDWDTNIIHVRPGSKNGVYWEPKTRLSIRRIPIVPEMREILERLRDRCRRDHWVFESRRGTQLGKDTPTLRFRAICDDLGLNRRYVVHSLRKFWSSTLAAQGFNPALLAKVLGHADLRLIMDTYYAQNDDERLVAEASKVDFGLGPSGGSHPGRAS